ncbi:hypothetical protein BSIN_5165 [Burkholderia singularis]|uniref:Uncharacterized protein n=1 Tax=Burkholderia singularis TaxID=1503053 RepID=A0A238HAV7_9BURK|nr:hypothetical protein BSIN_5165 [Burkholderia singularis]
MAGHPEWQRRHDGSPNVHSYESARIDEAQNRVICRPVVGDAW